AEPLLPEQLLQRSKMGFSVPLADWFRSDSGGAVVRELLEGPAVSEGYLDAARLQAMHAQHRTGAREWSAPLWSVFCFDQFLRGEAVAELTEEPSSARLADA